MQNPERSSMRYALAGAALAIGALSLHEQPQDPTINLAQTPTASTEALTLDQSLSFGHIALDSCVSVICLDENAQKRLIAAESKQSAKRIALRRASRSRRSLYPSDSQFDRLAGCESTGDWSANTGNGYYGGIQFDLGTWRSNGGTSFASRPDLASRGVQIIVGRKTFHSESSSGRERGWSPWPACSRKLGLR